MFNEFSCIIYKYINIYVYLQILQECIPFVVYVQRYRLMFKFLIKLYYTRITDAIHGDAIAALQKFRSKACSFCVCMVISLSEIKQSGYS